MAMYEDLPAVTDVPGTAEILGISEDTVRSLIARGELKSLRLGRLIRIPRHDLVELLTRGNLEPSHRPES